MNRSDFVFVIIVLLVVLALVLVVVNIGALFPTPPPEQFAQTIGQGA